MSRILQDIETCRPYNYIEMNNLHASYERNAPLGLELRSSGHPISAVLFLFVFLHTGPTSKLLALPELSS